MEYRSVNSVKEVDDSVNYSVKFLNLLNPTEFPPHINIKNWYSYNASKKS
jgi:hypothetical protein